MQGLGLVLEVLAFELVELVVVDLHDEIDLVHAHRLFFEANGLSKRKFRNGQNGRLLFLELEKKDVDPEIFHDLLAIVDFPVLVLEDLEEVVRVDGEFEFFGAHELEEHRTELLLVLRD